MGEELIVVVLVVVFLIGKLIYKYKLPEIRGARGEASVARQLKRLSKTEYLVFHDLYLKSDDRFTQIDHLVLSVYGIFVIETKNYDGWIHGNQNSEYWSQTFFKKKIRFRNPIKQNWAHVFFLKQLLTNVKPIVYYPIVVFAGNGKLKNVYSELPVIYTKQLLRTIKKEKTPILNMEDVRAIASAITQARVYSKTEKRKHKTYVMQSVAQRKKSVKSSVCPNCGGPLILRKGAYGKFYGCSNFPKCKFSKSK